MSNNSKQLWQNVPPQKIIFVDIETASQVSDFEQVSPGLQKFWLEKKLKLIGKSVEEPNENDFYFNNAGLYAEFGRVVCISIGCLTTDGKELHTKTFANIDETVLLSDFTEFLEKESANRPYLCGHNIKEFDVPYLCRRMLIKNISLPTHLDVGGLKPWDVAHFDTMELWKFGDNKNYTKLALILETLGIESPKDDIDGSDVNRVFWKENDLPRIIKYCEKDVIAVAQLLLRFRNEPLVEEDKINIRDWHTKE